MILNIAFSYNRAMQLDCFIDSFVKNFINIDYQLVIIYHTSSNHGIAYELLIKKYNSNSRIIFYERSNLSILNYYWRIKTLLLNPKNLYRFIKHSFLRKGVDDFKFLMEDIIANSKAKYIMFSTDDTYYDNEVVISDEVLAFIDLKPKEYSYRLCLGKNMYYEKVPNIKFENNLLHWNYYESSEISGWKYPFIVDATIYDKETILNLLKGILYHMPATLESFINTLVVKKGMFSKGLAPEYSCMSNIWLNRVQKLGFHDSIDLDVEFLNEKFIDGYTMKYYYDMPVNKWGIEPYKVILEKGEKKEIVYERS